MEKSRSLDNEPGRLRPIGTIRSDLKDRKGAPKQGGEGAPDAWIDIFPWAAEALYGLTIGDELIVMTDVCLCAYTDHGHCGILEDGHVLNDASLVPGPGARLAPTKFADWLRRTAPAPRPHATVG